MKALRFAGALAALALPCLASAHEVYVLPKATIAQALMMPSFSEWDVMLRNFHSFVFWGFIAALTVFCVFFISLSRILERLIDPITQRGRPYAAPIARVTVGISFLAAAYYQASYGPELPLAGTFGAATGVVTVVLVAIGILIIFGIYARLAAAAALLLFLASVYAHGIYMLTYTNYLGEIILLLILGAHHGASRRTGKLSYFDRIGRVFAPYSFFLLRVCFGVSLLYASVYAKIIHNNLALDVAYAYPSLVHFFGFEPHFLVLGAAIVEIVIAAFFILGIEIRFTSLFLLFWLSLSLWYFGEVVWPHIILIGIPIAFIFYGYDKYSVEGAVMKRYGREPVL